MSGITNGDHYIVIQAGWIIKSLYYLHADAVDVTDAHVCVCVCVLWELWGFHGGDVSSQGLLGCDDL